MTALSLVMLKRHLPPPAATSAFSALISHCASSEAMKKGSWHDWSQLLHAFEAADMQCSDCPDLTRLCDRAVRALPRKLIRSLSFKDIIMPLSALVAVGYTGSAQPLLQAVTASISQGRVMNTARFAHWRKLTMAAIELSDCGMETVQQLEQFADKASNNLVAPQFHDVSTFLNTMRLALWPKTEFVKHLAKQAAEHPWYDLDSSQLSSCLCSLAFLGHLDISVRCMAATLTEADLTALKPRELTNLLYARSMFLALSIQQAVSLGHSQLASDPGAETLPTPYQGFELAGEVEETPSMPTDTPAQGLCDSEPPSQPKLDLEQLVVEMKHLPVQVSSSPGKQLVQVAQDMADWNRLEASSRRQLTIALLQCLGVGNESETANQLSMAALSLVMLKRHLPPPAATSAFSAFIRHCANSKAMKRGGWRFWSKLLDTLGTAGLQCSTCPDLTRLCDQAVQLLPREPWRPRDKHMSRQLIAMATVGYRGSAQPLLQAITTAFSQGRTMHTARFRHFWELIRAATELPSCRTETRQLLDKFAAKASGSNSMDHLDAEDVSTFLNVMRLMMWPNTEFIKQLVAGSSRGEMDSRQLASSLYSLACLGYLDSSVRDLAATVAEADLTALCTRDLTNLLHAQSMFLALSIHQAVSSGHSQLASEPQLDSMAAALWRECSRRGPGHKKWGAKHLSQLYAASQWLDVCTGGQTSLAESPAFLGLVAKALTSQTSSTESAHTADGCTDYSQLVRALAAAGDNEVEQAALSLDGTVCTQLVVKGPGLTRGIAVYQSHEFLPDGSMSGVVAHVKLQQLNHFDAGVVVNKAVFDQLASDSERAAFMRGQVRASLPEAEAWRRVLQMLKEASRGDESSTGYCKLVLVLVLVLALRQYDTPPRPKQDLEQLVSAVEELPLLTSSSQVEQTSQLLWCFAD
ncbi:hypothetical protein QJQ45_013426 [Haematococcus lacustris]|nr:hypothetical protein QJQ45_013426 [Haematococcus lacustris]